MRSWKVFLFFSTHLWRLEALLRKHGVPLAVLEVEPGGRSLHWHQGRHRRCLLQLWYQNHPQPWLDGSIAYKKIFQDIFCSIDWRESSESPTVMVFNTLNSFHVREGGNISGSVCSSTWRASWCSCSSRCPSAWSWPPPSRSPPGSRALAALGEHTYLQQT